MSTTVDQAEVQHFNSTNWWHGINLLHMLNEVRKPFVIDCLKKHGKIKEEYFESDHPLKDLLILDVGCGGGIFTEVLAQLGATITAIDPGQEVIRVAKQHAGQNFPNLSYSVELVEDHAKTNFEKYDVVIVSEVVEHVSNPDILLEACIKCSKPGGSIFVTTINKTWIAWILYVVLLEKIFRIIPMGTHEYDKLIAPATVEKCLTKHNCQVKELQGVACDVVTRAYYWSSSTLINYFIHAIKNN